MYLKWFVIGVVYLALTIVGCVLHLPYFTYHYRAWIRYNEIKPFWWFVNNTLPEVKGDRDYGDFGRFRPKNWWAFYQQNALRNPFHNLKITYLAPKKKGFRKIIDWEFLGVTFHIEIGFGDTKYLYTFKTNLFSVMLNKLKTIIMSKDESKKEKPVKPKQDVSTKNFDGDNPKTPPKKD
jgi:hypothetical protein